MWGGLSGKVIFYYKIYEKLWFWDLHKSNKLFHMVITYKALIRLALQKKIMF